MNRLLERGGLVVAWAAAIALFGALSPDIFLTGANFSTIFGSQAVLAVLALALVVPLTAGDYDLSIAGTLSLSSMLVAILNAQHHVPLGLAILAALAAGALVGATNGMFAALFEIDPFIVTLGTGTVLQGLVLWLSDSATISGVSTTLSDAVVGTRLLGVSLGFWYGIVLCVVLWVVFEYTPLGRRLLFAGRGRRVAALCGLQLAAPALGRAGRKRRDRCARGCHVRRRDGRRRPHLRRLLPAARVRGRVPRRDRDRPRPLQPVGLGDRGVLPRDRDHRADDPRRRVVGAGRVLRHGARAGRRALDLVAPTRRGGDGRVTMTTKETCTCCW